MAPLAPTIGMVESGFIKACVIAAAIPQAR
jgi:hypothetical protein